MWTVSVMFYTLLTDSDVERYPYAKHTIFVFDCALTATYCILPFYFIFFVAAFAMIIVALIYRCEHALDAAPYSRHTIGVFSQRPQLPMRSLPSQILHDCIPAQLRVGCQSVSRAMAALHWTPRMGRLLVWSFRAVAR